MVQKGEATATNSGVRQQLRWLAILVSIGVSIMAFGGIFLAVANLQLQQEHEALMASSLAHPDANSPAQVAIREQSTGAPLPPDRYRLAIALLATTGVVLIAAALACFKDRSVARPTGAVLLLSGSALFLIAQWALSGAVSLNALSLAIIGAGLGVAMWVPSKMNPKSL